MDWQPQDHRSKSRFEEKGHQWKIEVLFVNITITKITQQAAILMTIDYLEEETTD